MFSLASLMCFQLYLVIFHSFAKMVPQFLFDEEILRTLDFEDLEGIRFNPEISNTDPGENLALRPLKRDDYSKGIKYTDCYARHCPCSDQHRYESLRHGCGPTHNLCHSYT